MAAPARCGSQTLISGPRTLAPGFHRGSRRARQLLASARRGASSGGIAPLLLSQPAPMLMELTDSGLASQHSATAAPHLNLSHGNEPSISPASMTTRGESSLTFSRASLSHRPPPALPPSLALSECSTFLPPSREYIFHFCSVAHILCFFFSLLLPHLCGRHRCFCYTSGRSSYTG